MKVIVASMLKCGTKTLHKCLEVLGYTVADFDYHLFDHGEEWKSVLLYGSRKGQFHEMYKDIDAVCDLPPAYYWEEIAAEFPDAKIILTTRNSEDEWLRSYQKQMDMFESSFLLALCFLFTPTGRRLKENLRRLARIVFGCPPQALWKTFDQPNEELLRRRYREHNATVLARCEEGKLLHFKFSDGWEPLCTFLNKDIPDVPFPHENKKSELNIWDLPNFAAMKKELNVVFAITLLIFSCCIFQIIASI